MHVLPQHPHEFISSTLLRIYYLETLMHILLKHLHEHIASTLLEIYLFPQHALFVLNFEYLYNIL